MCLLEKGKTVLKLTVATKSQNRESIGLLLFKMTIFYSCWILVKNSGIVFQICVILWIVCAFLSLFLTVELVYSLMTTLYFKIKNKNEKMPRNKLFFYMLVVCTIIITSISSIESIITGIYGTHLWAPLNNIDYLTIVPNFYTTAINVLSPISYTIQDVNLILILLVYFIRLKFTST